MPAFFAHRISEGSPKADVGIWQSILVGEFQCHTRDQYHEKT